MAAKKTAAFITLKIIPEKMEFEKAGQEAKAALAKLVERIALEVEAEAKMRAPVRTGFLRASIYTDTPERSGYFTAEQTAIGLPEGAVLLPPSDKPPPGWAYVRVGAEYGIYQEMGTVHMPAHPYLIPGAMAVARRYPGVRIWTR